MGALLIVSIFLILVLIGFPIAISLGLASIIMLVALDGVSGLEVVADIMYTSVSKFTLLAIPFFILTGLSWNIPAFPTN